MKLKWGKTEINHFVITLLVVTLVFGFNDFSSEFIFSNWLGNFFKIFIVVLITLLAHVVGHKWAAKYYGARAEHRIWTLYSFGFKKSQNLPIKVRIFGKIKAFWVGFLIPLVTTVISNGRFFLPIVESFETFADRKSRFGKKFSRVTEYELAKIAFAGPFANLVLIFVFKIFNSNNVFELPIIINSLFVILHMLPIPGLDGSKIYFGSRPLYAFTFSFVLFFILLMFALSVLGALILAILLALVAGIVYYYFKFYK